MGVQSGDRSAAGDDGAGAAVGAHDWPPFVGDRIHLGRRCLTTPTSLPFWKLLPPLEMVQFPWRLLLPISLLAAGLLAIALRRLSRRLRWLVLAGGLAEAAAAVLFAVAYGDHGRPSRVEQAAALRDWLANEAEYIPADARAKGWLPIHDAGASDFRRMAEALPGCSAHHQLAKTRTTGGLAIDVAGCVGPTPLPQFYFPGWSATAATALPVDSDPGTGLVRVNVPPGTATVVLTRKVLPQETAGLQVTAAALLLWLIALLAAIYPARALKPTRRLSPIRQRVSGRE